MIPCPNCRHPISPEGRCISCNLHTAGHSGTWAEYYRDCARWARKQKAFEVPPWVVYGLLAVLFILAWWLA